VDLVNVRTGPFLESNIIARLDAGYVLEVLKRQGDWVLADTGDGLTGWIYVKLLRDATEQDYRTWMAYARERTAKKTLQRTSGDSQFPQAGKKEIRAILNQWKEAWEAKDVNRYMNLYSKDFFTPTHDWTTYRAYKQYLFKQTTFISVTLNDIRMQQVDDRATVRFIQTYQSDSVHSTTKKVMRFRREKGQWKIIEESVIQNPT